MFAPSVAVTLARYVAAPSVAEVVAANPDCWHCSHSSSASLVAVLSVSPAQACEGVRNERTRTQYQIL